MSFWKHCVDFLSKIRVCLFLGLFFLLSSFGAAWLYLVLHEGRVEVSWSLQCILATALPLTIIFLSLQQLFSRQSSQEKEIDGLQKQLVKASEMEKLSLEERRTADQEIGDLRKQLESCREELFSREQFLEERNILQIEALHLSQENNILEEDHLSLCVRLEEQEKIQQALLEEIEALKKEALQLQSHSEWEVRYKQLQRQFQEKSEVLHQTRRELFYLENRLLAFTKEKEEACLEENSNEKSWLAHIVTLNNEQDVLEQEISLLEALVTKSYPKEAMAKPRFRAKSAQNLSNLASEASFATISTEKKRQSRKKNQVVQQDLFNLQS